MRMPALQPAAILGGMPATYAVTWSGPCGPVFSGELELGPEAIVLRGARGRDVVVEQVPYRELRAVRRSRNTRERVGGRASLVLELLAGGAIRIDTIGQPGALHELGERISTPIRAPKAEP